MMKKLETKFDEKLIETKNKFEYNINDHSSSLKINLEESKVQLEETINFEKLSIKEEMNKLANITSEEISAVKDTIDALHEFKNVTVTQEDLRDILNDSLGSLEEKLETNITTEKTTKAKEIDALKQAISKMLGEITNRFRDITALQEAVASFKASFEKITDMISNVEKLFVPEIKVREFQHSEIERHAQEFNFSDKITESMKALNIILSEDVWREIHDTLDKKTEST